MTVDTQLNTTYRKWPLAKKRDLVQEAIERNNFYAVAKENQLQSSVLFRWRKQLAHLLITLPSGSTAIEM